MRDSNNNSVERTEFANRLDTTITSLTLNGLTVTHINAAAEHDRLERFGLTHFTRMHRRLVDTAPDLVNDPQLISSTPPGPHFDYRFGTALFGGRAGSGPLLIALDTNQLLDYHQHGSQIWRGLPYVGIDDPKYLGELDSLALILALLVVRDIRLIVLPEALRDARRTLPPERHHIRRTAFDHFALAIRHFADGDEDLLTSRHQALHVPDAVTEDALTHVPGTLDRMMVRAALHRGAHVFMTRDEQVLKASPHLRPLGLLIASPGDVLEELFAAGAFNCLLNPRLLQWPLPDQHRVGHLIQAIAGYKI